MKITINNFPNKARFYYRDKNNYLSSVELNNCATTVAKGNSFEIKIYATEGRTPGTYYSGNRPITNIAFQCDNPEIILIEKTISGISNAHAFSDAEKAGAIFVFDARNNTCAAIFILQKILIVNPFGTKEETISLNEPIIIEELTKSSVQDYLSQIIPSGNIWGKNGILFSGWKRPDNVLENGDYILSNIKSINFDGDYYNTFIPFAYSKLYEHPHDAHIIAEQYVSEHLKVLFPIELVEQKTAI